MVAQPTMVIPLVVRNVNDPPTRPLQYIHARQVFVRIQAAILTEMVSPVDLNCTAFTVGGVVQDEIQTLFATGRYLVEQMNAGIAGEGTDELVQVLVYAHLKIRFAKLRLVPPSKARLHRQRLRWVIDVEKCRRRAHAKVGEKLPDAMGITRDRPDNGNNRVDCTTGCDVEPVWVFKVSW